MELLEKARFPEMDEVIAGLDKDELVGEPGEKGNLTQI